MHNNTVCCLVKFDCWMKYGRNRSFQKKNFYFSFEINSPCSIPRSDQNKSSIKSALNTLKTKKKLFIFTKIRDNGEDLIKSDYMAWHTQDRQRVAERKIIIIITIMLITTNASSSPKTFLSNHIPFFNFSWKKSEDKTFLFWKHFCYVPSFLLFSFFGFVCASCLHTSLFSSIVNRAYIQKY